MTITGSAAAMRKLQCLSRMRITLAAALALGSLVAQGQNIRPSDRPVNDYAVAGPSRLAALAKLGAQTNTSLLIEVDSLVALQVPITLAMQATTVGGVVQRLLPPGYVFHDQDSLLIVSPRSGAKNRVLTLLLGSFKLHPDGISGLEPYLAFTIQRATGCNPKGFGWGGPLMSLAFPQISLANATFVQIVARVADAPEASMWIVTRETTTKGCIHDPASKWQVGLYGFGKGSTGCQLPFRESVGPEFIAPDYTKKAFIDDCNKAGTMKN